VEAHISMGISTDQLILVDLISDCHFVFTLCHITGVSVEVLYWKGTLDAKDKEHLPLEQVMTKVTYQETIQCSNIMESDYKV